MVMMTLSVRNAVTSGCVPASTWRMTFSSSGRSAINAAAKAYARVERPEPGGPVINQACERAEGSDAAARSVSTAASCPHTSAQGNGAGTVWGMVSA